MRGVPEGMSDEYAWAMAPQTCDRPVMYTLHTCRHCVRLKDFLAENGVTIREIYVDDFEDPARSAIMKKLRTYTPRGSFPTLVLPDGRTLVGFRIDRVRELFGLN